ncbi:hypothetical protein ACGFR8_12150 [Streptomyces brevispora]|uniref:hypothetical protein n=1 Tax=Streptomyces brevispora TaxID=887462 RepID=UPI0037166225
MEARYCGADSENGDRIDDPSEDAPFMTIGNLNDSDDTFVVVQPDEDDPRPVRLGGRQGRGAHSRSRRSTRFHASSWGERGKAH